jgi:mRNA interferase RelE/StbE
VASYEVLIKPSAVKELEQMPLKQRRQMVTHIRALSSDPRPPGSVKLTGLDRYRVRQGDHRAVYEVDDATHRVTVVKIGHRREVYR